MGSTARPDVAPPRNAGEMLARGREFLERKGLASPRLEAELLVAHALGLDRLRLYLQLDRPVAADEVERARALLVRRARREPSAYITGRREFYGRPFAVGPEVLVPRPESELLVDLARERLRGREAPRVGDVGTGSGCLAISIALEHAGARVAAVDRSAAVELVEGDGPRALAPAAPFDLIVSNPPYVTPEELARLEPEVRDWEPAEALLLPPGAPAAWIERLLDEALPLLAPRGALLVELGAAQGALARAACAARGLEPLLHRDLAGIERVLEVASRG